MTLLPRGTGAILSPTLVSPKRQRGTTGQGIREQIQAIGLVISLKRVARHSRFWLMKTKRPSLALPANEEPLTRSLKGRGKESCCYETYLAERVSLSLKTVCGIGECARFHFIAILLQCSFCLFAEFRIPLHELRAQAIVQP